MSTRLLAAAAALLGTALPAVEPYLVKDINPTTTVPSSSAPQLGGTGRVVLGGRLYFAAREAEHGVEVWGTDGTAEGTALVADIASGPESSNPSLFALLEGRFTFVTGGSGGPSLWASDGTAAGTTLLHRFPWELPPDAIFAPWAPWEGHLVFAVSVPDRSQTQLWITDGTVEGTTLLGSFSGRAWGPGVAFGLAPFGQRLAFLADEGEHGEEPWVTDGTPEGTRLLVDIAPGPGGSYWGGMQWGGATPWQGRLVFKAMVPGESQGQLWITDGTVEGTTILKTFPVADWSAWMGLGFAPFGPQLIFGADDGEHGAEPWITDGTPEGTRLLKDIAPGPQASCPLAQTRGSLVGGRLAFAASDPEHGRELWITDGTAGGTLLLADSVPGPGPPGLEGDLEPVGERIVFRSGDRCWTTDGTPEGTVVLVEHLRGSGASQLGDRIVLDGFNDLDQRQEIWITDGTREGTVLLKGLEPAKHLVSYSGFTPFGERLAFWVAGPEASAGCPAWMCERYPYSSELWVTDGTAVGTTLLAASCCPPSDLAPLGDALVFAAADPEHGSEPWVTDGTPGGTVLLEDIDPRWETHVLGSHPRDRLTPLGERIVFSADDGEHGEEVWISDGTEEGTSLLGDILPGARSYFRCPTAASGNPLCSQGYVDFMLLGQRLVFEADDGVHEVEPWVTDGTPGGTGLLVDIATGPGTYQSVSFPHPSLTYSSAARLGGLRIFAARSDESGEEPWVTDSTPEGTRILRDINPGTRDSHPAWFTPLGDRLFFVARDPQAGWDLWVTDGTPEGTASTSLARDLGYDLPGDSDWVPQLEIVGSLGLRIVLRLPSTGGDLWITDGALDGTAPIGVITLEGLGLGWRSITVAGRLVFWDSFRPEIPAWITDGAEEGTRMLSDAVGITVDPLSSWADRPVGSPYLRPFLDSFGVVRDRLVFPATEAGTGAHQLWSTDGTADGTRLVASFPVTESSVRPHSFTAVGSSLVFSASDPEHGQEVWITDGTGEGTRLLADAVPGVEGSWPGGFALAGERLFFAASDPAHGRELWALPLGGILPPRFRRGDANDDGALDMSDAIATLGHLFLGSPEALACAKAADADDSGEVDISDAVSTLGYLFLGGPAPPAPFPDCGADPSADALACVGFLSCE